MTDRFLQRRVIDWHNREFPVAPNAAVALKFGEEAGELLKAANRLEHGRGVVGVGARGSITTARRLNAELNIAEEIGDVLICLTVLAHRYADLLPTLEGGIADFRQILANRIAVVAQRRPGDV